MKRIIPIRLDEDVDLRTTIESYRITQQQVSEIAYYLKKNCSALELHRVAYPKVKGKLKSQLICTAIRSVASEYAKLRKRRRRLYGPIHFSKVRALFLIGKGKRDAAPPRRETIRIWTLAGRKDIRYSIPKRFAPLLKRIKSYDAIAVRIKKGRLVATLSVTLVPLKKSGSLPAGVSINNKSEIGVVDSSGRSIRIITVAQNVMEEISQKTKRRLNKRLAARKADGLETRSVRRFLKRLGRRRYVRTKTFCHTAANKLIEWVKVGAILVIEDLRLPPPSKRRRGYDRPHFYEILRRRIEEKAELVGIPVHYVSVVGSKNRCSLCGDEGKITSHRFYCKSCNNREPISKNAAINIINKFTVTRPWVAVNQP
jgi:putative transposase